MEGTLFFLCLLPTTVISPDERGWIFATKKKHEKKPAFGRCPAGPSHISPFQLRQHLLLRGAPAPRSSVTQNASRAGEGQRPEYILDMPGSVLNVFCVFLCIVMRV